MFRRPNPVFGDAYAVVRQILVAARRRSGLTQRALAARISKSASHIARIESGQRRVDTLEFYLIARALRADPCTLFAELVAGQAALEATRPETCSARETA